MLKITEPKKVLCIHDLSGVGRCSLAVILPVLSVMGIQPVALPTVVLSTHTGGFGTPARLDGCAYGEAALEHYRELGLSFDCIYTGYLGGEEQAALAEKAFDLWPSAYKVVDPVMGDNGKMYAALTEDYPARMRKFIEGADIITPNITEVALLLDEPFTPRISPEEIKGRLRRLSAMGPQTVVATSVPLLEGGRDPGQNTSVIAYERDEDRFWRIDCAYIPAHYPGTGDTFSSVLTGSLIQGDSLSIALDRAVQFVTLGIRATFGQGLPSREGILLERILGSLFAPVSTCKCRIMDGDGCCNPVLPFED